jgi:hypothetical protein
MALPAGRVIPQPPFVFDDKDIISPRAYIDLRWSPSQYLTDADGVFLDDRVDLETIQFDQNRPFEWLVFDKRFIIENFMANHRRSFLLVLVVLGAARLSASSVCLRL